MAVSERSSSSAELLKAGAHIWNQTFNFKNSACLKCAVQLGIADVIEKHGKPMTLSELSAALPIHPSKSHYVYRLMRILLNSGFFVEQRLVPLTSTCNGTAEEDEDDDDKEEEEEEEVVIGYGLTPAARLLLQDEPLNARALVLMVLDPVMVKPWNALTEWFQNDDETPFDTAHGKNFWDYNAQEPRLRKLFNEAMASDSHLITKVLMQDCKFAFEGLTSLVDVGGGTGTVARAIAKNFPTLKCTVFDLPHVVANQEPMKNLDFVAGDMLHNIPPANSILLKWILHDWSDEDCVKILKNCKKAINSAKENGGKVIIIDMVMESQQQDNNTVEAQISLDMQMLILYNAKERTEKEWTNLFWEAGFSDYKIFPMLGSRSLIEVYP